VDPGVGERRVKFFDVLCRVRSAKASVKHWVFQRITAIALLPLGVWFILFCIPLISAPHEETLLRLSSPLFAICAILFVSVLFYHGALGMQAVFEDYIPQESLRSIFVRGTKYISTAVAVLAVLCILKVVVGHAPGL
jgi:succinate dehydrogenase / fumarate reductase membrane anchor subunit